MRATDLPPRAYESRCACSCAVPWRAASSSSGSSRLGRASSPRVAASSCCVRCGHSRKPVRSLALRISRPSVRCMRTPRSCVELQLLRARVGLSRRTGPDHRQHVADAVAVRGPEEQFGHAGKLAGVVRQMVAGEIVVRAAALEAQAAERGEGAEVENGMARWLARRGSKARLPASLRCRFCGSSEVYQALYIVHDAIVTGCRDSWLSRSRGGVNRAIQAVA